MSATRELARLRDAWRRGGAANTPAQHRARRANAQRAGRPGRVCVFCGEPVVGGHVERALDTTCGAHGWRWARATDERPPVAPDPALLPDVLDALTRAAAGTGRHRALIARVRAALAACGAEPER